MSAAFTMGPWVAGPPLTSSRRVFMPDDCIEVRDGNRQMIACLYAVNASRDGTVDRANAALIAAAPSLYSALEEARFILEGFAPETVMTVIDAALAKAGEQ